MRLPNESEKSEKLLMFLKCYRRHENLSIANESTRSDLIYLIREPMRPVIIDYK